MADGQGGGGGLRISDPQVMRALAHPARVEIVEYLNNTGEAVTATECARLVGLSPSATSYHLRELARYGLVEQAPSRGDGRERVWRSTSSGLRIDADLEKPGAADATRALVDLFLARDLAKVREWVARLPGETEDWQESASLVSHELLLTADELAALNTEVQALVERYKRRERQHDAPPGARRVQYNYMAFPVE